MPLVYVRHASTARSLPPHAGAAATTAGGWMHLGRAGNRKLLVLPSGYHCAVPSSLPARDSACQHDCRRSDVVTAAWPMDGVRVVERSGPCISPGWEARRWVWCSEMTGIQLLDSICQSQKRSQHFIGSQKRRSRLLLRLWELPQC